MHTLRGALAHHRMTHLVVAFIMLFFHLPRRYKETSRAGLAVSALNITYFARNSNTQKDRTKMLWLSNLSTDHVNLYF